MMDKIELGIEFEQRFRENLWGTLKQISDPDFYDKSAEVIYGDFFGSAYLLPESRRAAAKDGLKIGDIILNGEGFMVFVDCTSTFTRSDNRLKSRVRTSSKDLAGFYEYVKTLNTYPSLDGEPYPNVPGNIIMQYNNVRSVLIKYLDNTFNPEHGERWHQALYGANYGTTPYRFYGAIAFEYANDIFVTLLSDATIPALSKNDPSVDELLPLSFTLAGFALFVYESCSDYSGIGQLDFTFNDIIKQLDIKYEDEDDE